MTHNRFLKMIKGDFPCRTIVPIVKERLTLTMKTPVSAVFIAVTEFL